MPVMESAAAFLTKIKSDSWVFAGQIQVPTSRIHLYGDLGYEVASSKYFVADLPEIGNLVVVDRNHQHPIVGQEVRASFSRG